MSIRDQVAKMFYKSLARLPHSVMPSHYFAQRRQFGLQVNSYDTSEVKRFSQYGQEAYIWDVVLQHKATEGFFLDIGAYDGMTCSNTKFFEDVLGWKGLLIEPNPVAFSRLCANRRAASRNCGVGNVNDKLTFLQCHGVGEMLSCFKDFATPEHLQRVDLERRKHDFCVSTIEVPVFTISSLLQDEGVTRIDFLSIDVEGFELDLLRTFPFHEVSVGVCAVEANGDTVALEKLMLKHGFYLNAIVGTDHIYVA
jgi:FkbM family methyltransferase